MRRTDAAPRTAAQRAAASGTESIDVVRVAMGAAPRVRRPRRRMDGQHPNKIYLRAHAR
jgi:hypothetical protein